MIKGTTPTLLFKVNNIEDFTLIEDILVTITYEKDGVVRNVNKKTADLVVDNIEKTIKLSLTQQETLAFQKVIGTQMKILLNDGRVFASKIFVKKIDNILNREIMEIAPIVP